MILIIIELGFLCEKNISARLKQKQHLHWCFVTKIGWYENKHWKLWRFLLKKCQDHIPFSFAYKLLCVDDKFSKSIVVFRGENAAYEFIKAILKEHQYCKKSNAKTL